MTLSSLDQLNYVQHFAQLPEALHAQVMPKGIAEPKLVCVSASAAALLDLDCASLQDEQSLAALSGNAILSNWQPLAMKYTGHQFGQYNPDLGDGRGLLLAQVQNQKNQIWDLHLKGAGTTPFSRQGDGRAVLRSSIREFLCSEAMAGLGIPTTRALSVVSGTTPVMREKLESAATLVRLTQSHIRFGHFEYCSFTGQHDLLKQLADHVIAHHYPELAKTEKPYTAFFETVLKNTAELIAQWQCVGFAHGVMNTDNMSILGETFDYGPFAFLDDYVPSYICNHSDYQGRYAFNQQPNIANWNLAVFAQALLPLCEKDELIDILQSYSGRFQQAFLKQMSKKIGLDWLLESGQPQDQDRLKAIIEKTLSMMSRGRLDYTRFFRALSDDAATRAMRDHTLDVTSFDEWLADYNQLILLDSRTSSARAADMNKVNPKFILRNYLAQNAIQAAQQGEYSLVQELHQVLQTPFDEQPQYESYAALPPDWGKGMEISCSS